MRLVNPKWEGYTWEILRDFKEESPAVSLLYWVSLTRIARDKNSSACVRHACAPSTVHISIIWECVGHGVVYLMY